MTKNTESRPKRAYFYRRMLGGGIKIFERTEIKAQMILRELDHAPVDEAHAKKIVEILNEDEKLREY